MTSLERNLNTTKQCPRCERTLHAIYFAANSNRSDGLDDYCRRCKSELNKSYRRVSGSK